MKTTNKISKLSKLVFFLILFLYVTPKNFAQNNIEDKAEYYLFSGKDFMDNGQYNKALYYLQTSLAYNSTDNYLAQAMAAISCRNIDLYASAIHYFKEGIDTSGGTAQSYGNLGAIYAEMGYDKLAFDCLNEAIESRFNYAYPHNNIGGILLRYGKYDEAITSFRKAIKYDKKMPDPYFNLGTAYSEKNNLDSAIYYYDRAIEANPNFTKAYIAKASALKEAGKPIKEYTDLCNEAIKTYNKIINQGSDRYDIYLMRANAYKLLGEKVNQDKDNMLKLEKLNNFIDLYPEAYTFIRDRAYTYLDMENKKAAISDLKRVLEINPEYQTVKKKLSDIEIE